MDCDVCFIAACLSDARIHEGDNWAKRDGGGSTAKGDCMILKKFFLVQFAVEILLNATSLKHESRSYCFIKVAA